MFGGPAAGQVWAEFLRVQDAETLATFTGGALNGWPAVTRRDTGAGSAWYVATLPDPAALARLVERAVLDSGIRLPAPVARGGQVEVVQRGWALFVINHGDEDAELLVDGIDALTGTPASGMRLPPQGVAIVRR